jgi:ribose-phosphate pyrophosphokinase
MILFSTRSAHHLAKNMFAHHGAYTIKQFNDGEFFVSIDEDVRDKQVWVLASTQSPVENLFELFFLLDALLHAGARINLFISYFAYARQVDPTPSQAHSAQLIGSFFKQFDITRTLILHAHNPLLHNFLTYRNTINFPFFTSIAQDYDAIVAPDQGASSWAADLAQVCNKELIILSKTRQDHEKVVIESITQDIAGKKLLIVDDIISTGRTLIEAAHVLHKMGATHIAAAATHGIFSTDADMLLEKSVITTITVTNSIAQKARGKIQIIDTSAFIHNMMEKYTRSIRTEIR